MAQISISDAWSDSASFVSREAALLMPVAFVFVALPSVVLAQFTPVAPQGEMPAPGAWMWLFVPAILFSLLGSLALNNLILRPGISVGEAIADGARRLPALIGAVLILMLAGMVAAVPLLLVAGLISGGNVALAGSAAVVLLLPVIMFVGIRMMFINPVAAAEPAGPVAILIRSFRLTGGNFFKLFALSILFGLLIIVVSGAVSLVAGIVLTITIGAPAEVPIAKLLAELASSLVTTVFSVYFAAMVARLYTQAAR